MSVWCVRTWMRRGTYPRMQILSSLEPKSDDQSELNATPMAEWRSWHREASREASWMLGAMVLAECQSVVARREDSNRPTASNGPAQDAWRGAGKCGGWKKNGRLQALDHAQDSTFGPTSGSTFPTTAHESSSNDNRDNRDAIATHRSTSNNSKRYRSAVHR